jgi:ribosomal RNA-processing protein 12
MEPIMGVKEHSEKVRKAAFELLVIMGHKMKEGGTINMELMEGVTGSFEDGGMARAAGVEEFVRMVAASLAADRDHTISAGVMSLSRVLFEFRGMFICSSRYCFHYLTCILACSQMKSRRKYRPRSS